MNDFYVCRSLFPFKSCRMDRREKQRTFMRARRPLLTLFNKGKFHLTGPVVKAPSSLTVSLIFVRTPSKQKSPKKEEEINIVELLRGHDPKEYERILRDHGIHDYRAILQAVEFLKKEKEMETGRVVRDFVSALRYSYVITATR